MKLVRHADIEKDVRALRRFAAPRESLEAWERLFFTKGFHETPGIDAFPGFGACKVYKGRVIPLRENVGKSKGYRVVFCLISEESYKILVFSRHGVYHSERELIKLVRVRLGL